MHYSSGADPLNAEFDILHGEIFNVYSSLIDEDPIFDQAYHQLRMSLETIVATVPIEELQQFFWSHLLEDTTVVVNVMARKPDIGRLFAACMNEKLNSADANDFVSFKLSNRRISKCINSIVSHLFQNIFNISKMCRYKAVFS